MSFGAELNRFSAKVNNLTRAIFGGVVSEVHRSIVEGSELTGAPGQPVDVGTLRASWQTEFHGPFDASESTNLVYAPPIEDGVGPYGPLTLRSQVGGWHSVKLTAAGAGRIVEHVVQRETQ